MTDIHYQDAHVVAARLHAGELSSVELTQAMLNRIELLDHLHAYVTVSVDHALAQAAKADEEIASGKIRSPLHGIPVSAKDLLATRNIVTTNGMAVYAAHKPDHDATVISRLAEAGTVLLGKVKLTEGAFTHHHPAYDVPVNPFDESFYAGVSSSGSGVATAAGLCFASLGTDTGGSIRFPSASNGIVGLKPTWGRVSRHGAFPLAYSLDHIGPMTRSVTDAALMLRIIAGHDPLDPTSSSMPVDDYVASIGLDLTGIRIGIDRDYIENDTDPEQVDAVEKVMELLGSLGCTFQDVPLLKMSASHNWMVTTAIEAAHAHRNIYPDRADEYGPISELLEYAKSVSAEDYMQAEMSRRMIRAQLDRCFQSVDVLLLPSVPNYAGPKEEPVSFEQIVSTLETSIRFTAPYDYSGSPTLSVPWHPGSKGLPTSVQLIGRDYEESLLCRLGHAIEQARGALTNPMI
ncbi:MAG: amidase [Sphingomonadales bacterium]|nr:amidase [Sphingomonadales bacterium]